MTIHFCRGMDAYSTGKRKFLARLRVTRKQLDAIGQTYYFAIPSKPVASPYESRLPCQEERIIPFFLFCRGMDAHSTGKRKFLARLRVTRKQLDAIGKLITSLFRRSLWLLLTNRAPHSKTDYSLLLGRGDAIFVIAFCHCV